MFFEDLGAYTYYSEKPFPNVRTIGWLEPKYRFRKGEVSFHLISKLQILIQRTEIRDVHVNPIRGSYECKFCAPDESESRLIIQASEIWLPDLCSGFFAAPSMLVHYIEEHRYLPPVEFLEAVDKFDLEAPFNAQSEYLRIYTKMTNG